jgi:hypothetical protein
VPRVIRFRAWLQPPPSKPTLLEPIGGPHRGRIDRHPKRKGEGLRLAAIRVVRDCPGFVLVLGVEMIMSAGPAGVDT